MILTGDNGIMEQCWNDTDRGNRSTEQYWIDIYRGLQNLGEKIVPVPLRPPRSPHELAWDRIHVSEASEGPPMAKFLAVLKTSSDYFQIQQ